MLSNTEMQDHDKNLKSNLKDFQEEQGQWVKGSGMNSQLASKIFPDTYEELGFSPTDSIIWIVPSLKTIENMKSLLYKPDWIDLTSGEQQVFITKIDNYSDNYKDSSELEKEYINNFSTLSVIEIRKEVAISQGLFQHRSWEWTGTASIEVAITFDNPAIASCFSTESIEYKGFDIDHAGMDYVFENMTEEESEAFDREALRLDRLKETNTKPEKEKAR